jgi:hypothetical protein
MPEFTTFDELAMSLSDTKVFGEWTACWDHPGYLHIAEPSRPTLEVCVNPSETYADILTIQIQDDGVDLIDARDPQLSGVPTSVSFKMAREYDSRRCLITILRMVARAIEENY